GTRDLAVVGIRVHDLARCDLPLDLAHRKLELAKLPVARLPLRGRRGRSSNRGSESNLRLRDWRSTDWRRAGCLEWRPLPEAQSWHEHQQACQDESRRTNEQVAELHALRRSGISLIW